MKKLYAILFALALGAAITPQTCAQISAEQAVWTLNDNNRSDNNSREQAIEVSSKEGNIYVRTPRKIQVTIYTILGQVVTDRTLNPGLSEIKIGTRGIYLVKIEGRTQKVAL